MAALCHDVDHPGNTNVLEINTCSDLATLYNDQSVLENHHAAFASRLMKKKNMNFLENFELPSCQRYRKLFCESILATDMVHHTAAICEIRDLDRK